MSYEEDYRTPYRADCACGKGFLRYYKITSSSDWFHVRESSTAVEMFCDSCKEKYYYTHNGSDYLVPIGLSFPKNEPQLDYKYHYDRKENVVKEYDKEGIEAIIADMTAPKHRYIKDLTTPSAYSFAEKWYGWCGKKSLAPMVDFLQTILEDFDNIKASCDNKTLIQDKYFEERDAFDEENRRIKEQCFRLTFLYDREQDEAEREREKKERAAYEDAHRYDDFTANVTYDQSFKKDWTNQYWDTYLIKECTDPQYLTLSKPIVGTPEVRIAKKYKCICQLCGNEAELLSLDFKINYDSEIGYSPQPCCSCHSVSSFEAKVMEILNNLGISYVREKTFDDLVGDSGKKLRFDFGLYKNCSDDNIPIIDLIIELQGPHHYKEGYYDEYGEFITDTGTSTINSQERLERQLRYDQRKKDFCITHGINFETIKYTISGDYEYLENKLIGILQKYEYKYWY